MWTFIDPSKVIPSVFGLQKIFACKLLKSKDNKKRKKFSQKGWIYISDVMDKDPITGKVLEESSWYIFAATGK